MNNQDFKISFKTVWFLVVGNILLTVLGAFAKIQHWENSQILLTIGLMLFFSTWVIILSDMVKNKIYNKTFWILTMFIMPTIATIFYMIQRNKLIRLGQKFALRRTTNAQSSRLPRQPWLTGRASHTTVRTVHVYSGSLRNGAIF